VSKGLVNPGLDHPPPALGDGDRDNDMFGAFVGVPGMVGRLGIAPCAVSPVVAPEFWAAAALWEFAMDFKLEERRRRCVSGRFRAVRVCEGASLIDYLTPCRGNRCRAGIGTKAAQSESIGR